MAVAVSQDVGTLSIATVDYLPVFRDASLTIERADMDGSATSTWYESAQAGKAVGTFRVNLMKLLATPDNTTKTNNLDVAGFAIAGTSYLGSLESGNVRIDCQLEEGGGIADGWEYPTIVKKRISADSVLRVPSSSGSVLPILQAGAVSSLDITYSVTIDGVAVTFAGLLKSLEHVIAPAGVQKYNISILGRAQEGVTFPTAPTGTTTILEKFLNTTAALAFEFETKQSGGTNYSGNLMMSSYNLRFAENQVVMAEAEFRSYGALTVVAGS